MLISYTTLLSVLAAHNLKLYVLEKLPTCVYFGKIAHYGLCVFTSEIQQISPKKLLLFISPLSEETRSHAA